jgi:hypothetical protein
MSKCANCKLLEPKHRCIACPLGSDAMSDKTTICPACGVPDGMMHKDGCQWVKVFRAQAEADGQTLCSDCPPWEELSNGMRCAGCPRRNPVEPPPLRYSRRRPGADDPFTGAPILEPELPGADDTFTKGADGFVEITPLDKSQSRRIKGQLFAGDVPMKLLDRLARAALDAISYADHDADCPDRLRLLYKPEPCTCGYAETHIRVLRLAQQVADMQKGKP